ncbi:MAG: tetratricopeptide repeat protein [Pseudomonadales bacterium]|jgi:tetratricopeptide (TPR) repeat protein|nr:tetratricopeptide repeat protein [Pseudomonadales bacterium]
MNQQSAPRATLGRSALVLALCCLAGPLLAAETVIGLTNAQRCYEYALAEIGSLNAADVCTEAIERETLSTTDLAATYCNRGLIFSRSNRTKRAIADFDQALAMDPTLVHALINRGNVMVRAKRFEDALKDYEAAIFYSEGRNPLIFYNRSIVYEKLGRLADAREDLLRALQLRPDSRQYREALASLE